MRGESTPKPCEAASASPESFSRTRLNIGVGILFLYYRVCHVRPVQKSVRVGAGALTRPAAPRGHWRAKLARPDGGVRAYAYIFKLTKKRHLSVPSLIRLFVPALR